MPIDVSSMAKRFNQVRRTSRRFRKSSYIFRMSETGKRRFLGIVRTQGSSTSIPVDAKDERSATKALQDRYGTENIIEVRGVEGSELPEAMSQAEADVRNKVMLGLPAAWFAIVKWVLLGPLRK
ncbi:MAG: hypothetical protein ACR652_21905 [Methylocystis sp.]|uniref:hypothetical protein n=1 Tax=Methylocystis sp. TaxID=1911079 RepID=UPI003DA4314D